MDLEAPEELTEMLRRWSDGDDSLAEEVLPLVYDQLHRIARRYFRRERPGHTLQATAVVHEAYLQLVEQNGIQWQNRAHFVGRVAHMMRRVLVDHARERGAAKRGGGQVRVTLSELGEDLGGRPPDLVALDDSLRSLEVLDPQKAAIVELRFFGGLTIEETAHCLRISTATVTRQWRRAKAWLLRELSPRAGARSPSAG